MRILFTTKLLSVLTVISYSLSVNALAYNLDAKEVEHSTNMVAKAKDLAPYQDRKFQDEVFYFVLPDRFENGDKRNDLGASAGDKKRALSRGGLDLTHKGMYHGGDLQGLTNKLDYLDNMGVTAVWLTPILRNQAVQDGTSGYHGYWILDFTEIDPHLGSNADLKHFIDQAHQRNIKVFFDIITNHTADVIKYKECHGETGNEWLFEERNCPFKSLAQVAKGDTYTPFIQAGNETLKHPQWLNNKELYHNQGDSHWQGESALRGDFSGLDDLYTENPVVVNGMVDIYKNIITEFKPDGFRIDTVKHVNIEFWQAFSPALLKHAHSLGINNFFMFGEVYSFGAQALSKYTREGKIPSVLDFALQGTLRKVLVDQGGTDELANLFSQDHFYQTEHSDIENTNANQLVNFTGNHDMGRFAHFLDESKHKYNEQEQIQRNLLAHAFIYFGRGVPVVYYGDEQGFVGRGGDQASRQDMMPSKVLSYNEDNLIATDKTTADNNFDTNHLFYQTFAKYAQLYQQYPALRFGKQTTLYSQKSPGMFVFSRALAKKAKGSEEQTVIVGFNTANTPQEIHVNVNKDDYDFVYASSSTKPKLIVKNGKDVLLVPPLSFVIYQQK